MLRNFVIAPIRRILLGDYDLGKLDSRIETIAGKARGTHSVCGRIIFEWIFTNGVEWMALTTLYSLPRAS
jgi:hypothetical protein